MTSPPFPAAVAATATNTGRPRRGFLGHVAGVASRTYDRLVHRPRVGVEFTSRGHDDADQRDRQRVHGSTRWLNEHDGDQDNGTVDLLA